MININKVTILGNLTKDPELKALPSGGSVASFGVATNRAYKGADGQRKDVVEFHNVVVFGKQAENTAQYMKKGSQILIEGRLQTRSYEKDGNTIYRTEIIAEEVKFGSSPQGTGQLAAKPAPEKKVEDTEKLEYPDEQINLEDIPF